MKILLTTLNSKFIHSSLALRSLQAYCNDFKDNILLFEYTINNSIDMIVNQIYKKQVDVVCFSCYIWNIEMTLEIVSILKKVNKNIKIILGGPEVTYSVDEIFANNPVDIIVMGEGEESFHDIVEHFVNNKYDLKDIKGIAYKECEEVKITDQCSFIELDKIPFVYTNDLKDLDNRIIYYESTRGCPFSCQYCMSSVTDGVRYLSIDRVYSDLNFFLKNNVKQVKFVDRTFNCNHIHTIGIWKHLIENDNGITNFHFEISADLITKEQLQILKTARSGLFQFEIGVQSTNENTLSFIKRKTNLNKLFDAVNDLNSFNNINQHLDLIAGLPGEDYLSFSNSFNEIYVYEPQQLQLGFLKVLKGSGLRIDAERYGIVYRDKAPYEVLFTNDINFSEMLKLKMIEEMVEIFYNSGKFIYTLKYVVKLFETPFIFYEELSSYWCQNNYDTISHSKVSIYNIFLNFCNLHCEENIFTIKELIKYDIFLMENTKNIPNEISITTTDKDKANINSFFKDEKNLEKYFSTLKIYSAKQRARMCHIEKFDINILDFVKEHKQIIRKETFILFNYYEKDDYVKISLGNASTTDITEKLVSYD